MKKYLYLLALAVSFITDNASAGSFESKSSVYRDTPFLQKYSVKYYYDKESPLLAAGTDRNGVIQVLSTGGLLVPDAGFFLYPGSLVNDHTYLAMANKQLRGMEVYDNQFVYLDSKAVLSNAWAGNLYSGHSVPEAKLFAGGKDFMFMISDGNILECVQRSKVVWKGKAPEDVIAVQYAASDNSYWILGKNSLSIFSCQSLRLSKIYSGQDFTSFCLLDGEKAIIGTSDGYLTIDARSYHQIGAVQRKLPSTSITAVSEINGQLWFGSDEGAFMLREDGKYDFYNGERWLPGNKVISIGKGPGNSILILTDKGLGRIVFEKMTLEDKAVLFEKQVRSRHIRYGFNATLSGLEHGNLAQGHLSDSDNDGLWTSMYLGSQVFRYAVTRSEEALQNCAESLDAMERLYTINPVPGFPSRSFERKGMKKELSDPERWQNSPDPEWDWKATTSSDEAIGHIFSLGALAELVDVDSLRSKAVHLIDELMQHIVDHDFYLVDYDGKPTTWGKWNPEYVNARPKVVGDRKINSSNIIAMLQTAYHFTRKEIYRQKTLELMQKYGYLENLMRPMKEIGHAPADADDWSKMLSDGWNHSDDEMYFLGYWGLYRYALNDTLKTMYKKAIIDHWQYERPEKDGLWDIMTAITGAADFDLDEAVWYLKRYPLDLIDWSVKNSDRKDIEPVPDNFRGQTIKEVLPPDELPVRRHNANRFQLDSDGHGNSENSAGDIWLLPYWLGRYLGVISSPES